MTLDLTLLYTNTGNVQGLHAAKETLRDFRPDPNIKHSTMSLVQLMEFVLTKHPNSRHKYRHYNMASSYANVSMGRFEEDFAYTYPDQPPIWKRLNGDCFCFWTGSRHTLDTFIDYLKSFHFSNLLQTTHGST